MRHLTVLITVIAALLYCSSASAQFLASDNRQEFITLSTSTTTAVVVGVVMLTVVSVRKDPTALNLYLKQNEPAVRLALATGGGASIEDLAAFFEIEPVQLPRFAALLRRHRTALCRAAYEPPNGQQFATLVQNAIDSQIKR